MIYWIYLFGLRPNHKSRFYSIEHEMSFNLVRRIKRDLK